MSVKSLIVGTGRGIPNKILTNQDFERMVDTTDEWIVQRTGIRERHVCGPDEAASDLAIAAGRQALERANIDPRDLDMIIVATVTGDYKFPSTACIVQAALGATRSAAFDLGAACAGFIHAVATADAFIRVGQYKRVLVIGVDVLSKYVDYTDRSTCILFGDAAGAIVLQANEGGDRGVIHTVLLSDGSGALNIVLDKGGSKYPDGRPEGDGKSPFIKMNGAETYRFSQVAIADALCKVLEESGLTANDVDLFVPHQANKRIIDASAERIGLPTEKVFVNIHEYGNTSAGSVPLGLYEAEAQGRLKPGHVVLTVGFGAGLVWGANLIRW